MREKSIFLSNNKFPSLYEVWSQIRILLKLATDWKRGTYKGVSRFSILLIFLAIIYFFIPFDIIPDFLLGLGFLDDIVVVSFIYFLLGKEIEEYKKWKACEVDFDKKVY